MKFLTLAFLSIAIFAGAADMTDFDGDGLPDLWEANFGIRTNSAAGIDGAYGDMDNDGLNNQAEYLAGYTVVGANVYSNFAWAIPGLCPTNSKSLSALFDDGHFIPTNSLVPLSWLFTDNDFIADSWEFTNSYCSVRSFDENVVIGGAKAIDLYQVYASKSAPKASARLVYNGIYQSIKAPLIFEFYTRNAMDGSPDAVFSFNEKLDWKEEPTVNLTNCISGKFLPNTYYVGAFLDVNSNGKWDDGEPFGVANPFGRKFGFGQNGFDVELRDYAVGLKRSTLVTGQPSVYGTHVRVIRMKVDDNLSYQEKVLDKYVRLRQFIHEGDIFANGQLSLDWGLIGVPPAMNPTRIAYNVIVGDDQVLTNNVVASFTNTFSATRAQAVSTYPVNGAHVYDVTPTFVWAMPDTYTAFQLEIKKGSSSGLTVYQSGTLRAPIRDAHGLYSFKPNIYGGTRTPSGEVFYPGTNYAWRVIAMNAKYNDTASNWSDWKLFRLSSSAAMQNDKYGSLAFAVKYFGAAHSLLAQRVKVQLFDNPSFGGFPFSEYTLAGANLTALTTAGVLATNTVLDSISPGTYYARAFIDHNLNNLLDVWESKGFYMTERTFMPAPLTVVAGRKPSGTNVIVIADADSDGDRFPDAWEFEQHSGDANFLELVGPSTLPGIDAEINPTLTP